MVLHTFGRDLKWNPHIHCLISEGGYSDDGEWLHITHFNYTFLRNAFRTALLNEMESLAWFLFQKGQSLMLFRAQTRFLCLCQTESM
ncbi:MAG: transposase [Lachnospiraceae bacterium]